MTRREHRPRPRERRGAITPGAVELLALLLALAAAIVLVWPAAVTIPAVERSAPTPPVRPAVAPPSDSLRDAIVATNLFSGSRRAPRERFRLPGTEPLAPLPTEPLPLPPGASEPMVGPQLFGIVQVDGTARALLQVQSDLPPRLVAVGDRVGGWRVQRIAADRIELQSSSGTRTVRLSRRSPSDSSGSPP